VYILPLAAKICPSDGFWPCAQGLAGVRDQRQTKRAGIISAIVVPTMPTAESDVGAVNNQLVNAHAKLTKAATTAVPEAE
jgi:hypothetical protein